MRTSLLERKAISAESYRVPMPVTHLRRYSRTAYYICPRCNTTMEREFMAYCDRCGQCLGWKQVQTGTVLDK